MLTEPGVLAEPVPSEPGSDFTLVRTVRLPRGWVSPDPEVSGDPRKYARPALLDVDIWLGSASPGRVRLRSLLGLVPAWFQHLSCMTMTARLYIDGILSVTKSCHKVM